MKIFRSALWAAAVAALVGMAAIQGCSKDKGTNPGPTTKELDSGNIMPGNMYSHVFAAPGTFPYKCSIHSVMTGSVTVNASAPGMSASVDIQSATSMGFNPGTVSVQPGGTVTWTNSDGGPHTVTSN